LEEVSALPCEEKSVSNDEDISLPLEECFDHRGLFDRIDDLHVHDHLNTGVLINGEGHVIHSLKYNINGWLHEEPHHETHAAAQFLSVLNEKAPMRYGLFIIPFSGDIKYRVWPDSSADLSRLESTELILKIEDPTRHYYIDSPFPLFRSDFRERGAEVHTFCTYVKFPIDIVKGVVEYIPADMIRKTIDEMIKLKSKFRIQMPQQPQMQQQSQMPPQQQPPQQQPPQQQPPQQQPQQPGTPAGQGYGYNNYYGR